jgi:hypothetical protein
MIDDKPPEMDEKSRKEEQIRQQIVKLIEKDPKARDYAVEVGSGPVRLSSFLADLMMDTEGLIQFLQEVAKDSNAIHDILLKAFRKSVTVSIGHPLYLEPLRHFGSNTEEMGRFLLALVSGPVGNRRLVKALAKIKVRQVKFECSQDFYKRLMDEKLQRNLTVQQLAVRALERYFAVPESLHRRIEEEAAITSTPLPELFRGVTQYLSTFVQPGKLGEEPAMDLETQVTREHMDAILHYLQQLPYEKVELVRESLELDLKYYRTSRFKRTRQRKRAPGTDRGNSGGDD